MGRYLHHQSIWCGMKSNHVQLFDLNVIQVTSQARNYFSQFWILPYQCLWSEPLVAHRGWRDILWGINHLFCLSQSTQKRTNWTHAALLERGDSGLGTERGRVLACHETGLLFLDLLQKTSRRGCCCRQALSITEMMSWHQALDLDLLADEFRGF